MFDKLKDTYRFQQQARQIQKELKNTQFSGSSSSGSITVTANGMQRIESVSIQAEPGEELNLDRLGREITDVANKVLEKAQKASAEKMKTIMGGMGLPGM